MKIIYIDTETTGLEPDRHGVHQISGYVEKDGVPVDRFNYKVRPRTGCMITPKALEVANVTVEQLKEYPEMGRVYRDFTGMLSKHINKFNKKDKAFFAGYNAHFDNGFIRKFMGDCGDQFFGSWFYSGNIDVMVLALNKLKRERENMANFQLMTVAEHMGMKVDKERGHDAMYDIFLTREMYCKIEGQDPQWPAGW